MIKGKTKTYVVNGKTITVCIENLDGQVPLFERYPTDISPQPARIELDPRDRSVCAEINSSAGGNSDLDTVYFGIIITINVSPFVSGAALIEFLEDDEFLDLVGEVFDGHEIYTTHHGSEKGRLTDRAIAARGKLDELANIIKEVNVLECSEWIEESITYRDSGGAESDRDGAVWAEVDGIGKITPESDVAALVAKTEEWIDGDYYVYWIEDYYKELIAELKGNSEYLAR